MKPARTARLLVQALLVATLTACGSADGGGPQPPTGAGVPTTPFVAEVARALREFTYGPEAPEVAAEPLITAVRALVQSAETPEDALADARAAAFPTHADLIAYDARSRQLSGWNPAHEQPPAGAGTHSRSRAAPDLGHPLVLIFVNGIANNESDAETGRQELENAAQAVLPGVKVRNSLNRSARGYETGRFGFYFLDIFREAGDRLVNLGGSIIDLAEAIDMRFASQCAFWEKFAFSWRDQSEADALGLAVALRSYVATGAKVVVVAHSQGNFIAQKALTTISSTDASQLADVAVLMVGSPLQLSEMIAIDGLSGNRVAALNHPDDPVARFGQPNVPSCWAHPGHLSLGFKHHVFVSGYLEEKRLQLQSELQFLANQLLPDGFVAPFQLDISARCTALEGAQVVISWSQVPGAVDYSLFQDGRALPLQFGLRQLEVPVSADTSYEFTLEAMDALAGRGAEGPPVWSDSRVFRTALAPCAEPTIPTLAAGPASCSGAYAQVPLGWDAVPHATSYRLLRDGDPVGPILGAGTRDWTDRYATPGATHAYRLRASNPSGVGLSSPVYASMPACTDTGAPDLIVDELDVDPREAEVGDRIDVDVKIKNVGDRRANASTARLRLAPRSSNVYVTDHEFTSVAVPALSAGSSYRFSRTVTIPDVSAGRHYVWVIADVDATAGQEDETDDKGSRSLVVTEEEESGGNTKPRELLKNTSFTSGKSSWVLSGDFWAGTDASNPRTSPGYAAGGVNASGYSINYADGSMYQQVKIPSNASTISLQFYVHVTTYEQTTSTAFDTLEVTIRSSNGSLRETLYSGKEISNLSASSSYKRKFDTLSVNKYAGDTIRIHFRARSDYGDRTVFRIDDVSLKADGD